MAAASANPTKLNMKLHFKLSVRSLKTAVSVVVFCVFHLCCVICLQSCRGEHFHESGEFLLSFAGFNAWTVSGPVDG